MKWIVLTTFVAIVAATVFGYRMITAKIDERIRSMQKHGVFVRKLRKDLANYDSCLRVFAESAPLDLSQLTNPDGKIRLDIHEGAYLTNLVDLGPVGDHRSFQARMKIKFPDKAREYNVGFLKISTNSEGKVIACIGSGLVEEKVKKASCLADNSPDEKRPGGPANRVQAPDGTSAVGGRLAKPVFGYEGVVKWLPMPACGPINFCQDGLWTTTGVLACDD